MMLAATAQNVIGLFLTLDRDLFIWITIIAVLISLGVVALLSNERRRWLELLTLFFAVFIGVMLFAHILFKYVVDVPFARMDSVSIVTDTYP